MKLTIKNFSTICPLPFNAVSYNMGGEIGPCTGCMLVKHKSIKDYWNSEELKQLRTDMLNGVRNPVCSECHTREDSKAFSLRQHLMQNFSKQEFDDEPTIKQLNLKFSNVCNYKCIDCSFTTASLIYKEEIDRGLREPHVIYNEDGTVKSKGVILYPQNDEYALLNQAKEVVHTVKEVAFSGGDPLYHWQQFDLLQYMVDNTIYPALLYYTNMSRLSWKQYDLISLWKNFPKIRVQTGFDAIGPGCDYFRKNMNFENTVSNLRKVKDNINNSDVTVVITFSWINAINAVDVIKYFYKNHPDFAITFNLVNHEHLDLRVATLNKKQQIQLAIKEILNIKNTHGQWHADMLQGILNYMWKEDQSNKFPTALKWLKDLDEYRKQDFRIAFPEHQDIVYSDYGL